MTLGAAAACLLLCPSKKQPSYVASLSESALINRTPKRAPGDPYLN